MPPSRAIRLVNSIDEKVRVVEESIVIICYFGRVGPCA